VSDLSLHSTNTPAVVTPPNNAAASLPPLLPPVKRQMGRGFGRMSIGSKLNTRVVKISDDVKHKISEQIASEDLGDVNLAHHYENISTDRLGLHVNSYKSKNHGTQMTYTVYLKSLEEVNISNTSKKETDADEPEEDVMIDTEEAEVVIKKEKNPPPLLILSTPLMLSGGELTREGNQRYLKDPKHIIDANHTISVMSHEAASEDQKSMIYDQYPSFIEHQDVFISKMKAVIDKIVLLLIERADKEHKEGDLTPLVKYRNTKYDDAKKQLKLAMGDVPRKVPTAEFNKVYLSVFTKGLTIGFKPIEKVIKKDEEEEYAEDAGDIDAEQETTDKHTVITMNLSRKLYNPKFIIDSEGKTKRAPAPDKSKAASNDTTGYVFNPMIYQDKNKNPLPSYPAPPIGSIITFMMQMNIYFSPVGNGISFQLARDHPITVLYAGPKTNGYTSRHEHKGFSYNFGESVNEILQNYSEAALIKEESSGKDSIKLERDATADDIKEPEAKKPKYERHTNIVVPAAPGQPDNALKKKNISVGSVKPVVPKEQLDQEQLVSQEQPEESISLKELITQTVKAAQDEIHNQIDNGDNDEMEEQ